ncbi:MAG TPA: glycine cleavage T C-terminal barrel domain-containing protein [Pyrinomonadaceae bacterium]|nr:glycine cleavage T C-terminal barrel domain-containing protein [Pyrinomonadaceae bacterium]
MTAVTSEAGETGTNGGAAEPRGREGRGVPADYGDARAEYEAVRGGAGCGLLDLSSRGRVEVSGTEAVQFLNGMVTNDVAALGEGEWFEAAFPNPQGRLLAHARVFRRGDSFLFDTEGQTYPVVLRHLERFTLAGDFRVRDLTGETAHLSVQGAAAAEAVRAVLGAEAASTARGRVAGAGFGAGTVTVVRATHTGEDGLDLFAGTGEAAALWEALTAAGARPVGADALEVLRVEAGLPRYGVDATEQNVVIEVVDEAAAVSYTKGCYVGQEIIARIHWRGHVAKKLTGLLLEGGGEVSAGARLRGEDGGREAGRVTSVVHSPRLGSGVALAVVKYDLLAPGTRLRVFEGEEEICAAEVAALPLVRGSWHEAEAGGGGAEVRA